MPESARDMPIGTRVKAEIHAEQAIWEKVSEDRWERRGWVKSGWIDGLLTDEIGTVLNDIREPEEIAKAAGVDRLTVERVSKALHDAGWRMPRPATDSCGHEFVEMCAFCGIDAYDFARGGS